MSFIKDALTERDGSSFDLKRIGAATFLVGFHVNEIYDVFWRHAPFAMKDYAIAAGMMLTALGAAIALGVKGESGSPP